MKYLLPILLTLLITISCDWTAPERSAFENDPILKELNAPKPEEDTASMPYVDRDYDPWYDQKQFFRSFYLPNAPWNKDEYWASGNALWKFTQMLENYPNFFQLDIDDQRRELEKFWRFQDTGFNLDKFIEDNRWFFPEKQREWMELHREELDAQYRAPQYQQPQQQIEQPVQAAAPPAIEEKKEEEPKEEKKEESKAEKKEEDLGWLDLAKEKWGNWTDSMKEKYDDKKEELKKKFSMYNETYYDKYHKDLPDDMWEKYRGDNSTLWEKTKDFFSEAGEKISNITHNLFSGDKDEKKQNETHKEEGKKEEKRDHRERREERKDEKKEERRDRDHERKDRDIERRNIEHDKKDKKEDGYRHRENLQDSKDKDLERRDRKDNKEEKKEKRDDKDLKFLEKKDGE